MQTNRKKYLFAGGAWIILLILTFIFLMPILWVIGSSFKSTGELFSWPPSFIGKNPTFSNYQRALEEGHFGIYFFNTVFTSLVATFLTIVVNVMSGYAFAKYRFKGDKILFGVVLATLMIPLEVIMIPIFKVIVATNLYNSLWGLIIPAVASPTAVFLVRQYYVDSRCLYGSRQNRRSVGRQYLNADHAASCQAGYLCSVYLFFYVEMERLSMAEAGYQQ